MGSHTKGSLKVMGVAYQPKHFKFEIVETEECAQAHIVYTCFECIIVRENLSLEVGLGAPVERGIRLLMVCLLK